jgi:hypothetical protein
MNGKWLWPLFNRVLCKSRKCMTIGRREYRSPQMLSANSKVLCSAMKNFLKINEMQANSPPTRPIQLYLFCPFYVRSFFLQSLSLFPKLFFLLTEKDGKGRRAMRSLPTTTLKIRNLLFLKPQGKRKKY